MLYSNELIFLHLQKTGGNHVSKLLARHFELTKVGKHTGLVGNLSRPFVLMGIRNPWDWYVSLWAYGCQNEGALHDYLTSGRRACAARLAGRFAGNPPEWLEAACHLAALLGKEAAAWRELYRDPEDAEQFRRWLRAIHAEPGNAQTGEDFSVTPLRRRLGLMTARYLKVTSRKDDWLRERSRIATLEDAKRFRDRNCVATHFIRTESLEEDLAAALAAMGIPSSPEELRTDKTNRSRHRDAAYYYDDEMAGLVAERDALVIEAHGYSYAATSS